MAGDRNTVNSGNIVHQNMIKRFNQHSIMVLKTCADVHATTSGAAGPLNNRIENGTAEKSKNKDLTQNGVVSTANGTENPSKRQRIIEKIHYEDLGEPQVETDGSLSSEAKQKSQHINLSKVERYLHGPMPSSGYEIHEDPRRMEEVQYQLLRSTENWNQRVPHKVLVSSTAAVNALGELSPGGALMRGFQEQSVGRKR